ncbi:isoaspartyl peptidase/L-asparaginase family protein [Streptomyces albireticuli]|uniref:Beta-aspartyl-peptidase n=1 Tax=Streptomyces albireticuli TaxID=1940 RepID=A0A2A2DB76_9ACTN|nr:isoaspartyl peptidase/L-asparaginase [Streptomyces albireticuli]MCD9145430.1 isoaspartyl peptidase/L-asparaginase [Streptomyces albireticuli]MCD9165005.1 isoaspartyl peptidase/L-asparaginase [Streptomyces albireticuli]MCD9195404.1 isoaspartyl peptidase/L-asparaginase [Streptomyces albireticuli]PAU48696.1 beta-aspartyl-peptidase [Streptomyces albireticuli]
MRSRLWIVPVLTVLVAVAAALPALSRPAPDRAGAPGGGHRPDATGVVLAVHGGAGTALRREDTDARTEKAYRDGLAGALRAGRKVLREGGDSVAAVEAAVRVLEDDELFNAGKGAVFNEDAGHELDASIMRGSDQAAGAVAGVRHVRNPVSAARLVMERTPHVLLAGEGADAFAARNGLTPVTQDYFWTQARWDSLMKAKERARKGGKAVGGSAPGEAALGTVGAVAVDRDRGLAAATSTGGMTNKMAGRVGDSPLVGAGTYARNGTVAASATGAGEVFVRGAATATLAHLIEFGGKDVVAAAHEVVGERLPRLGGKGGVIALDPRGVLSAPFSSEGMLHGFLTEDGRIVTRVFPDESPGHR